MCDDDDDDDDPACSFRILEGSVPSVSVVAPVVRFVVRWFRYSCAAADSWIGGVWGGISAPFCTSSSAIGKGIALTDGPLVLGRDEAGEEDEDVAAAAAAGLWLGVVVPGDAGSAAARARNTACVLRDRSATLTFARRAIP